MNKSTYQPLRKHRYCPECGNTALRVHRRWYERLLSFVVPVRRYRCVFCGWTGVVRQTEHNSVPLINRSSISR